MAGVLKRSAGLNIKNLAYNSPNRIVICCVRYNSSDEGQVKPLRTTKLTSFKKGTGGRSSFNGIITTVFGCSGLLGKYVINKLGKQGTQVICPYRGDYFRVRPLKLAGDLGQIQFLPFELDNEEAIYKALKYSNVVVNLIGRDNKTRNWSLEDVHVNGCRRIARIAREAGVERFIHLSSLNASEKPESVILRGGSEFLKTKWRGEIAVREEFPEATIIRPSDIYGAQDRFLTYYSKLWRLTFHNLPLWKKGVHVEKQPVFVSDVAKGIVNAIMDDNTAGKVYQAVGPNRYQLSELVDWFYRVMRKNFDWNYRRVDMRYDPLFFIKVSLIERIMKTKPYVCWERIEREHVTDIVEKELPTLEDLGVQLSYIEDKAPYELIIYRSHNNYLDAFGEFDDPAPPPIVPVV